MKHVILPVIAGATLVTAGFTKLALAEDPVPEPNTQGALQKEAKRLEVTITPAALPPARRPHADHREKRVHLPWARGGTPLPFRCNSAIRL